MPTPICPKPTIENQTNAWTAHDQQVLSDTARQCKHFYGENYCIKVLKKTGENSYQVLCYIPPANPERGE